MRIFLLPAVMILGLPASAQAVFPSQQQDSDHDGLSDALEIALLAQFAPQFMVSEDDCSARPAEFVPFRDRLQVQSESGAIYGQAFPREGDAAQVELHYYDLWRRDCGEMGHPLDAEHVSVLVARDGESQWKALYWYAAAHENTVCDASQIARAAAIHSERQGPEVWISRGKHASYLNESICESGCGGDRCRAMVPLGQAKIINLGEPSIPMNGASWAASPQWPLAEKMNHSDFSDARIARVDRLPATSIAWANPDKRPMQAAISGGHGALLGVSAGLGATDTALDTATSGTGTALDRASGKTGSGLAKAARGIKNALRATGRKIGLIE